MCREGGLGHTRRRCARPRNPSAWRIAARFAALVFRMAYRLPPSRDALRRVASASAKPPPQPCGPRLAAGHGSGSKEPTQKDTERHMGRSRITLTASLACSMSKDRCRTMGKPRQSPFPWLSVCREGGLSCPACASGPKGRKNRATRFELARICAATGSFASAQADWRACRLPWSREARQCGIGIMPHRRESCAFRSTGR